MPRTAGMAGPSPRRTRRPGSPRRARRLRDVLEPVSRKAEPGTGAAAAPRLRFRWSAPRSSPFGSAGRRIPSGRLSAFGLAVAAQPFPYSARADLGELGHSFGVILGYEERAGQHWLATTDRVPVGVVQPQHVDRLIALDIGLLIDRKLYLALRDQIDRHGAHVERADLRLRARRLDGVEHDWREWSAKGDDKIDRRVLLQLGLHAGLDRRHVVAGHIEHLHLALEGVLDAVATRLELHRALLLVEADNVLGAFIGQPLSHGPAGDCLVLSRVAEQILALPLVDAGVEADDRNAGRLRRFHRRRLGVGESERQ